MAEEDPEMMEVKELGEIERRKMGLTRAHGILLVALSVVIIVALLFVALKR
jgi:hypothetical protein